MSLPEEPSFQSPVGLFFAPVADSCYFVGKSHSTKDNSTLKHLIAVLEPFILMVNIINIAHWCL